MVQTAHSTGIQDTLGPVYCVDFDAGNGGLNNSTANLFPVYDADTNTLLIAGVSPANVSGRNVPCCYYLSDFKASVSDGCTISQRSLALPVDPGSTKITLAKILGQLCVALPSPTLPAKVVLWNIGYKSLYLPSSAGPNIYIQTQQAATLVSVGGRTVIAFYADSNSNLAAAWISAFDFAQLLAGLSKNWIPVPIIAPIYVLQELPFSGLASYTNVVYDEASSQLIVEANRTPGTGQNEKWQLTLPIGTGGLPAVRFDGTWLAAATNVGFDLQSAPGSTAAISVDDADWKYISSSTRFLDKQNVGVTWYNSGGLENNVTFQLLFSTPQIEPRLKDFGSCIVPPDFFPFLQTQSATAEPSTTSSPANEGSRVGAAAPAAGDEPPGPIFAGKFIATPTVVNDDSASPTASLE